VRDFAPRSDRPLWTPASTPAVLAGIAAPPGSVTSTPPIVVPDADRPGVRIRGLPDVEITALALPVDVHFGTRLKVALRLWRVLNDRPPGADPQRLPEQRRMRLVLALRALDGRLAGASYREIADVMAGPIVSSSRADWTTDPRRDWTIRLARLGVSMMRGGYRHLLLYPYRRRS
jgi:hypothetical protein